MRHLLGTYKWSPTPDGLKEITPLDYLERRPPIVKPSFTYDGEWNPHTNLKQGRGVLITRLGSIYEGWFLNDKFHFRGRIIW